MKRRPGVRVRLMGANGPEPIDRGSLLGTRSGVLLPVVLLLLLGLGGVSLSVFTLVSTQRLTSRSELRYLEERVVAEQLLGNSSARTPDGFRRGAIELTGDFRLIEAARRDQRLTYLAVHWVLNPDSIIAGLPGALRHSGETSDRGVAPMPDCPSVEGRPLVERSRRNPPGYDEPDLRPPRLGILGVGELLPLAGAQLSSPALLPGRDARALYGAGAGTVVRGGQAAGALIAGGDLTLEGSARFEGLLIVDGNLTLREHASVHGVALVGGSVRITDEARLFGCPEWARRGLDLAPLSGSHPLPDGWFLGRF